jgi:hypothetical protein
MKYQLSVGLEQPAADVAHTVHFCALHAEHCPELDAVNKLVYVPEGHCVLLLPPVQ